MCRRLTLLSRIGYLTFSVDPRNGMGRFARELILRVVARGHTATVLTYHKDEVAADFAGHERIEVRRILPSHYDLAGLWCNLRWGKRVARELAGCDFLHSVFDFPHTELAARAGRRLGVPFIASAIGTYSVRPLHDRRYSGRLAVAFEEAYRVIAISQYTRREIEKRLPLPQGVVVPLGVDAAGMTAGVGEVTKASDRFDVLGVGALKDRKGWDLLVRAAAALRDLQPALHVTIAGGLAIGQAEQRYRDLATELGIADRVHFPGLVGEDGLKQLYASAHVFAMPSRSDQHKLEGFGLVYLEAGAFGLPQVGCLDTGAEEPIIDGETGFLVPQNDVPALAEALRRLHGDIALRERLGEAARARARLLTWDATVDAIIAHYPSAAHTTRRRPSLPAHPGTFGTH